MARRASVMLASPRPTVIRQTRIVKTARRAGGAIARAASSEKHTIAAVAAAAAIAFAKKQGVDLPKIDALGTAGTYGLVLWAVGRYTKSPMAQHAATGLMSIAVAEMMSGDRISGDDAGEL
jgi:hypothetical protein